jgi:hypothetical protein
MLPQVADKGPEHEGKQEGQGNRQENVGGEIEEADQQKNEDTGNQAARDAVDADARRAVMGFIMARRHVVRMVQLIHGLPRGAAIKAAI